MNHQVTRKWKARISDAGGGLLLLCTAAVDDCKPGQMTGFATCRISYMKHRKTLLVAAIRDARCQHTARQTKYYK